MFKSLVDQGTPELGKHAKDLSPIDTQCPCPTCSDGVSRALLHHIITQETAGAHGTLQSITETLCSLVHPAVTQHNITFQARLMGQARDAIINGMFPDYLRSFFVTYFGDVGYPEWTVNALRSVGVDLLEGKGEDVNIVRGDGAKWEYSDKS